jgi:hypothetical protein
VITEQQALVVLGALAAAFPTHPRGDDTAAIYTQGVATLADADVLHSAAVRWIATQDWFPTVHQLVEAYQAEARARATARKQAEEARAIARGTLSGLPPVPANYGIEMVDVLRLATEEATAGERKHSHDRGPEHCPTCSQADAIAAAMEARIGQLLASRGIVPPQGPLTTYLCPTCLDRGSVIVDDEAVFSAYPCPTCNPRGHGHWKAEHRGAARDCRLSPCE